MDHGTYTIAGTITDSEGGVTPFATTVVVTAAPEVLIVNGSTVPANTASAVNQGSPYTLTLNTAAHPAPESVRSWTIDWNDGTVQSFSGIAQSVTHVYAESGEFHDRRSPRRIRMVRRRRRRR